MTFREFNAFCPALPATTYVVQWGGSHVWKVGGKIFAIASGQDDKPTFAFKVSDIAYEMLKDQPGLRPAPYLASRGMKRIQHFAKPGLSDAALRDHIPQSHFIVSHGLSRKRRIELGLETGVNSNTRRRSHWMRCGKLAALNERRMTQALIKVGKERIIGLQCWFSPLLRRLWVLCVALSEGGFSSVGHLDPLRVRRGLGVVRAGYRRDVKVGRAKST
jgi:predicted DNA-binding protein (MmcQ/YjbR family)